MRPKQLKAKDLRAFAVVPIRALKDPRVTPATFQVLAGFCSYADHMGRTFVSMARVGQDVGLGKTGVAYHVPSYAKPVTWFTASRSFAINAAHPIASYMIHRSNLRKQSGQG